MKDILKVVGMGTNELVIFDLDNTVFQVLAEETTEEWFEHRLASLMKEGDDLQTAKNKILPIIEAAQCTSEVRLVDSSVLAVMNELRGKRVPFIALTARTGKMLERATFRQLGDLGVSFSQEFFDWDSFYAFPELCDDVFYRDGVLFVDGKDKGVVLDLFFKKTGFMPDHIIFIDDSLGNVKAVECMANQLSIRFNGFHFTYVEQGRIAHLIGHQKDRPGAITTI